MKPPIVLLVLALCAAPAGAGGFDQLSSLDRISALGIAVRLDPALSGPAAREASFALFDPSPEVRGYAALFLAEIGDGDQMEEVRALAEREAPGAADAPGFWIELCSALFSLERQALPPGPARMEALFEQASGCCGGVGGPIDEGSLGWLLAEADYGTLVRTEDMLFDRAGNDRFPVLLAASRFWYALPHRSDPLGAIRKALETGTAEFASEAAEFLGMPPIRSGEWKALPPDEREARLQLILDVAMPVQDLVLRWSAERLLGIGTPEARSMLDQAYLRETRTLEESAARAAGSIPGARGLYRGTWNQRVQALARVLAGERDRDEARALLPAGVREGAADWMDAMHAAGLGTGAEPPEGR